ncbi:MAG: cytochrome P450 [Pseudomonadales bacterium]|nr:cytochrome P450 [Pseudomonadales bacterium]
MDVVYPELDFAISDLENLHEVLQTMREQHGPVVKVNFVGKPVWLINSYQTVLQALSDEEHLSCPEAYKRSIGKTMGTVMATMKGKQHRLNRAVVSAVFFPKRMRELAETVFADEARKRAEAIRQQLKAGGQIDLMQSYTKPLTFNIITRLLGLPVEDQHKMMHWADLIMASWDMENALKGREALTAYLQPVFEHRRKNPGDDFLSMLLAATVKNDEGEEEGLSDEEIFSFVRNLFPAGIDTSTKSLGSLLAVVLADQSLRDYVMASQENREKTVNELLRWQPPLSMVPRRCVKEIVMAGHTIKPGEAVMLGISGGNSDPDEFANPRDFNPERQAKILSFGHGEHYCIGTHMARRVLETAMQVLLETMPAIALLEDKPVAFVHGVLRGPRAVWVKNE